MECWWLKWIGSIVVGNFKGEPNSVNEFIQTAILDETIVIFGQGDHSREYISLNDMVSAVEKSVQFLKNNKDNGIFEKIIISSNEPISMADLAQKVLNLTNKGSMKHIDKTSRAFSICSKAEKANKIIDWNTADTLDSILRSIIGKLK